MPMVVRWPGRVEAGSTCDVPVCGIDFFPTFLEAAASPVPTGKVLDGISLVPLLTQSGSIQARALFWHFPIYLQAYAGEADDSHDPCFRTRPGTAMRQGKWKFHEYFEDGRLELYDLRIRPERTDECREAVSGKDSGTAPDDDSLAFRSRSTCADEAESEIRSGWDGRIKHE